MVYFGYQQSKGGYAYYYNGKQGQAQQRAQEKPVQDPDFEVKDTNVLDQGDDGKETEKAPDTKPVVMENVEVKKAEEKDMKEKEDKVYNEKEE